MDLMKLLAFLAQTSTEYEVYAHKKFIDDSAIEDGAVISIGVRDNLNFEFDKNGRLVGTSTNSINSYVRRK